MPEVSAPPMSALRPLFCGCDLAHGTHAFVRAARRSHGGGARSGGAGRGRGGAGGGRGTGAGAGAASANTGVQGYSPPPPLVSPIRGLIDFHTHAAPDIFGRAVDDDELATLATSRSMEALVFKNHVTHTADRAWLARKHVPGIKIFGGVVLNRAVGAINAQAVEWMWRMQGAHGRVIWFPTFDADNHVTRAGTAPSGVRVVDDRGAVLPEVREVLAVCARQRLVVHTGHSSGEQALALIEAAREAGCDRIVVTHAQFDVVGMTVPQMRKAAAIGAKMELCALGMLTGPNAPLEFLRHSARVEVAETAAAIKAVGARHFVLGTDLGQAGNPTPVDGLAMFVAALQGQGVTPADIQTMGRETPGALLMG
jgi:Family of unknown function (DUF6282)